MNTRIKAALCVALLGLVGMSFAAPASALRIRNCTDTKLKVFIYNNGDSVKAIALKAYNIDPGNESNWTGDQNHSGSYAIKVFKRQLVDSLVVTHSYMPTGTDYRVTRSNGGSFSVVEGRGC
jgi:hypothetical protein